MEKYTIYFRQAGRWIIIILVLWFIIHLSKSWLRPFIIEQLGGFTEKQIETKIDTVSITIDSIFPPKIERHIDVKDINKPVVEYTSNTTTKGIHEEFILKSDSIYRYNTAISDSLIDGNIITTISLKDCKLLSQSLNYTPKFPIFIEKTINVEKTNTEILNNKDRVRIGVGITGTSNKNIGGLLIYQSLKHTQIQLGYQRNLDNLIINTGSNKDIVSLSIIKLF
jgi:hypothetical protein